MEEKEFKKLVIEALKSLPLPFRKKLENVEIVIEDSMPSNLSNKEIVLGLYRGIPLKKRSIWYNAVLPDKITIYKNAIEKTSHNKIETKKRIKSVLYHEIGHYFGLTEEELR